MNETAAVSGSAPPTTFNVLGPLTAVVDGVAVRLGGPRQVAVLGRLVLSPGHVVSMEQLVDSVWDGDAPNRPDVAIRSYVSNLRRSIEPDRDPGDRRSCIESSPPGYRLNVERAQVDAHRFEGLLRAGQSALTAGDPAAAMLGFREAQDLWRGEVCEGMVESDAVLAYRSRLTELRLAMIELSSTARLELGELEGVIADVEAAIALHPLRERFSELAMLALYRAGRQSDALAVCRELRQRLRESLGVTPGRPIEELEHRILTHDPSLLRSPGPALVAGTSIESGIDDLARPNGTNGVPAAGPSAVIGAERASGRSSSSSAAGSTESEDRSIEGGLASHLVGRKEELATLDGVARDLAAGRGRTVVVTGESGIGKTALVEAFVGAIEVTAVWGRCRPIASKLPLWPWGQILDGLAQVGDTDRRSEIDAISELRSGLDLGSGTPPDTGRSLDGAGAPITPDPPDGAVSGRATSHRSDEPEREPAVERGAELFRPIIGALRRRAAESPLVVIVDDAQWADPSTIELLAFAGTSLASSAIAFIVVWREPNPGGPAAGLRALGRPSNVVRIPLAPLDRAAVDELLERRGIGGGTLAARILTETAGNASFVTELIADIGGAGDEASNLDPTGGVAVALRPTAALRDRVLDRLEEVDDEAEAILTVAAIHGPSFAADVLAEIVELPSRRVEEALEQLVGAGLATGEPGASGYRFTHPIVAKALISKLSGPRRARLHAAVGHALWRRGAPEAVLARHFSKAGAPGTSLLAARFALTATRDQVSLDDLFELEDIVRAGLDAMTAADRSDALAAELAQFLCQIARIRGQRTELRRLTVDAIRAATLADDPRLVGSVVLSVTGDPVDGPAFASAAWAGVALDAEPDGRRRLVELLRDHGPRNPLSLALALRIARLPPDHDDRSTALTTAELSSLLAIRGPDDTNPGGRHPQLDEAADVLAHVELAKLVLTRGDTEPLGPLATRFGIDRQAIDRGKMAAILDQRLDVERAPRQRGHERLLAARLRLIDGFDRSDPTAVDAVVDELAALPAPGSTPEALELDRVALEVAALLPLGELGRVERRIGRARSRCQRAGIDPVAFDRQLVVLRWVQGKLDALDGTVDGRSAQLEPVEELAVRALAAVGRGDVEPARHQLDELVGLSSWRRALADEADAGTVGLVAIAAAQAGDEETAIEALDALMSWTDRTVTLWQGLIVLGPGCLLAGVAAGIAGERAAAVDLLADAEDRSRTVGARAWLRQSLVAQAGLAAGSGDRTGAERLWAESVDLATEMVTGRRDLERSR